MRYRIGGGITGLGNPDKALLDNSGSLSPIIKEMLREAIDLYFKQWDGLDYDIQEDKIKFGIEPAYQYERLRIIVINRDKPTSHMREGYAWGGYGSDIASKYRFYSDYKRKGKFKKFVDKWHSKIFQIGEGGFNEIQEISNCAET